jgi:K+/H+ antiporter YhaU regulatory subunit KhtT
VGGFEASHAGVTVLAIQRGTTVTVRPGADAGITAGDDLVLVGRQPDLEALRLHP